MLLGVCGKTNVGKTTFFSACTLVDAEISNRVFTTIEPNKGVTYFRTKCPCKELGVNCNAQNSRCVDGVRYVPIKVVDVAGLVPDAHLGKGLGNQFLSDIMTADVLIHVVDISGSTDATGNPCLPGQHNPQEDIDFFKRELNYWILAILKKNLEHISKRVAATQEKFSDMVYKQLSGLNVTLENVEDAINAVQLAVNSDESTFLRFIELLLEKNKPVLIAANKIDVPEADKLFNELKIPSMTACSAEAELALRKAAEHGLVDYSPGDRDFIVKGIISPKQAAALDTIRKNILQKFGSTGVQHVIDSAVALLGMIVVYPVENEHKLSNKKGHVLPDAILIKRGSSALDLAYRVHEDIGKKFISAVDARTGKSISSHAQLKNGDVVSIKAGR